VVSPEVVILTKAELEKMLDAAFQRGVERGNFEVGFEKAQQEKHD
jgi:hypothetical protein